MSKEIGELFGDPIILVDKVEGSKAIINSCPICGDQHTHGNARNAPGDTPATYERIMAKEMTIPSHRVAHCSDDGGYWLIFTAKTEGIFWMDGSFHAKERVNGY